ncbi:PQQ-binding-like beta-propeller repeat protein [uncultured Dokdonia sp.]|uniref:outer membrane protein assembly factor BamB family protein n=1 Tax=uncultured Dokdonia sp. TaxID=575653 RepID=UPI0026297EC2|nr:PQQ-binding-like beta-propeller repeat protein [uncultured Dokdonia sp.]
MRTYKLLFLFLCIIYVSCNNDDDTAVNEEIDTSNLVNATASVATFNTLATIDLETGNPITTQNERLIASVTYENSFIGLLENRIVRNSDVDFLGEQLWEIDFVDGSDIEFDFNRSQMLIHNGVLYLNYVTENPSLPSPFPTLLAVDATTGTTIWVENQTEYEFTRIAILNNRMITVETFNNETRITSRDISDGSILNQWQVDERISHIIPGANEIIVMSWSNKVYSIDEDLSINWTFETDNSNVQRGAIVGNQFLFHSRDEFIYALDLQTGFINWSQHLPDLFISDFFTENTTAWSVTRDFSDNTFLINELDITNGTANSNFAIPALNDASEIEFINFDDYLLIISDPNTGATRSQLLNYKTQNLIWENEITIDNISILRANILLENNRYALSSFF